MVFMKKLSIPVQFFIWVRGACNTDNAYSDLQTYPNYYINNVSFYREIIVWLLMNSYRNIVKLLYIY